MWFFCFSMKWQLPSSSIHCSSLLTHLRYPLNVQYSRVKLMPSSTYLDSLSADELTNILRRQTTPTEPNTLLFAKESPFVRALPLCFTTIQLYPNNDLGCDLSKGKLILGVKGGVNDDYMQVIRASGHSIDSGPVDERVNRDPITENYVRVLRLCGRVFKYVVLDKRVTLDDVKDIESVTSAIAPYVVSGVKLDIYLNSEPFFNSTLAKHLIDAFRLFNAKIKLYQPTLSIVHHVAVWPELKSFSWLGDNIRLLDDLWEPVGGTLEEVDLSFLTGFFGWSSSLRRIREFCRRLSSIQLDNPLDDPNVSEREYADFLTSYGTQLKYVNLCFQEFGIDFCERVARECTQLRCSIVEEQSNFERLVILKERVKELFLTLDGFVEIDTLSTAMNGCRQYIMKLRILGQVNVPLDENIIKSIFASRFQCLEWLQIHTALNPSCLKDIANSTWCLKSVQLFFFTVALDMRPFHYIAKANPSLESIIIGEEPKVGEPNKQVVSVIDGLLGTFQCCHALQVIRFSFDRTPSPSNVELRNVCSKYRLRPFYINMSFSDRDFATVEKAPPGDMISQ